MWSEGEVSSDEEQEVFTGFTIEETGNNQQACQTRQEQNLLCHMDGKIETFLTNGRKKKKEKSDFQLYASKEMKEGDDESSDKEFLPEENENKHSSMV